MHEKVIISFWVGLAWNRGNDRAADRASDRQLRDELLCSTYYQLLACLLAGDRPTYVRTYTHTERQTIARVGYILVSIPNKTNSRSRRLASSILTARPIEGCVWERTQNTSRFQLISLLRDRPLPDRIFHNCISLEIRRSTNIVSFRNIWRLGNVENFGWVQSIEEWARDGGSNCVMEKTNGWTLKKLNLDLIVISPDERFPEFIYFSLQVHILLHYLF